MDILKIDCPKKENGLALMSPKTINSSVLREIYRYWDRLRNGRQYVEWAEIDAVDIPRKALPYVIVADQLAGGDFRYRLTGTKVDELIGVVPQGKCLSELPLDRSEELRADFRSVIERVEPQFFTFPMSTAANRYRETTRLVLPVASASGRVDMIFGAVAYSDPR